MDDAVSAVNTDTTERRRAGVSADNVTVLVQPGDTVGRDNVWQPMASLQPRADPP
jgi:hypothetical protein